MCKEISKVMGKEMGIRERRGLFGGRIAQGCGFREELTGEGEISFSAKSLFKEQGFAGHARGSDDVASFRRFPVPFQCKGIIPFYTCPVLIAFPEEVLARDVAVFRAFLEPGVSFLVILRDAAAFLIEESDVAGGFHVA